MLLAGCLSVTYVLLAIIFYAKIFPPNPVFAALFEKIPAIFPVKVTAKKNGKKVSKTLTSNITVKNYKVRLVDANNATVSGTAIAVIGTPVQFTAKTAPAKATVTYTSSDETIATVDATGKVTPVKAGKVTITAATDKATTSVEVEVKNVVLDSITPTEANKVVAVVRGNTKNLKKTDFVVTGTETKATVAVTDISVDAKDSTKVTLTLATKLTDAKEYGVTLDGTTKTFVASDGKVDSISVDPIQIPYAEATEIDLLAKDTKGIIVNRMKWNNPDAGFSFTFTKYDGTLQGEKLYLNKIGSVAEGKITYTSSEYNADGTPKVKLEQPFTITAVDQATVDNYAVRLGGKTTDKFDKLKDDNKLAVEDQKYAFIKIKDANDKEITDYTKYTVESSDKNILLLGSSLIDATGHYVQVKAVTTGTAYIIIKKDGKYCTSLPINVVAKREAASLTIDNATFTLSNTSSINDDKVVTAKAKDQYGDDIAIGANALSAECVYVDAKSGSAIKITDVNGNNKYAEKTANDKIKFKGQVEPGTYTWTINLKVSDTKTLKQTVSVTVKDLSKANDKNVSYALETSANEIDAVVKDDAKDGTSSYATVQIFKCLDGIKSDKQTVSYTVKKDGKVVTGAALSVDGNTVASEKTNGKELKITAMSVNGTTATKLATGTYEVTAEWTVGKETYSQKTQVVVKDTQTGADAQVVNDGVSATSQSKVKDLAEQTLKVVLGDTTYVNVNKGKDDKALEITKVEGNTISASGDITNVGIASGAEVNISKITFTAKTSSGVTYNYTVTVGRTVTNK